MAHLMLFGPALISILLAAAAQFTLKVGMSGDTIQRTLGEQDQSLLRIAIAVATSPTILAGFFFFGLSALAWLVVLARLDVSTAYPFFALGIALTVATGYFFLGETVSPLKLVGVATIVFGVLLVSLSIPAPQPAERQSVSD